MPNLAIFSAPTTNDQAHEHFEKTIANEYDFSSNTNLTNQQKNDLLHLYPSGKARFWGSRKGKEHEWKKLMPGDLCLIGQDGFYIYVCTVTYTFGNEPFAKNVWGVDATTSEIWEYIYFLDNFKQINIKREDIDKKIKMVPRYGFRVYSELEWVSKLGTEFLEDYIEQLDNQSRVGIEEEAIEEVEKNKRSITDLLNDAKNYAAKHPGYANKLKERKERKDDEVQKARIKKIEDYSCQICGFKLPYKSKSRKIRYSIEASHILAKNKGGDESIKNIIALCYNCHKKFDLGVIKIDVIAKEITENDKVIALHHDSHLFV